MSHDVNLVQKEIIDLLKKPLGDIIRFDQIERPKIIELRRATRKLITVGDTTTAKVIRFNVVPDVSVVDGLEKRFVSTTSIPELKFILSSLFFR